MSSRRDEILRELGLTPVWRLRDAQAGAPAVEPAPAVAAAAAAARRPASSPAARPEPESLVPADERTARILGMDWAALKAAVTGCTDCALAQGRNKTVFGVGDEQAQWLFVGEGPGADEDAQGEPFVGQAGRLLDSMLAAIGMQRGQDVYIANIVKCRPPGNRTPAPGEVVQCEPYLQRQIGLIRPRLIIALGKTAAVNLLKREASIASLRGQVHDCRGIPLIVTYHPAYLLRSLPEKAKAWEDLCFAVETMRALVAGQAAAP